jgi:thiosulfate dehydrogenase (quinone) large subunit
MQNTYQVSHIPEPAISKFFFADTRIALLWLIVRVYVGWEWFCAGWDKLHNPVWVGAKAGVAVSGFVTGALQKVSGLHPDVQGWYASFLQGFVSQHAVGFSYLVTYGEILVGAALIVGLFTGVAAFFGSFMNMNYLLAGTVSVNPILFFLQLFLILAWRVAGWYGLDRYLLPALGTPWQKGEMFSSGSHSVR